MYSRYRGTHRKLVIHTLSEMVGFFYVQEELVPGCLVDVVWLFRYYKVHCKKITISFGEFVWLFGNTNFIVKKLRSSSVMLFGSVSNTRGKPNILVQNQVIHG